jgi:exodeoxyribonuclease VII small subunit
MSEPHRGKCQPAGAESETAAQCLSFEQALERLERIVGRLEDGQVGLSESLAQYETGIQYLQYCYQQLREAERRIELLSGVDEDGVVRAEPFVEEEMTLEQKRAARGRRRSPPRSSSDAAARQPGPEDEQIDDRGSLF